MRSAASWPRAARSPRLIVDASAAFNQGAGIGRYARQVVPAALACLPGWRTTLVWTPSRPGVAPFGPETLAALPDSAAVRVRRLPLSRRRADQLWFRARLPVPVQLVAGGARADIVYSPDFTVPPAGGAARLATIHDLAYLICPEQVPAALRAYLTAVVPRMARQAARLLAVSETTRQDLIERLGVPAERVAVVPGGTADHFFAAAPPDAAVRQALGLPNDYLLTVGAVEPRKNHRTLFAALAALDRQVDLPLVIAGRVGKESAPILAAAATLQARNRVVLLPEIPDAMLPALYAGAAAMVYPSWYEGFGLPVLEALAAGTSVAISTAPALLEVAGPDAPAAAPGDTAGLAAAIIAALAPAAHAPAARAARQRRARRYSWHAAGAALAAVLREVVTEHGQAGR